MIKITDDRRINLVKYKNDYKGKYGLIIQNTYTRKIYQYPILEDEGNQMYLRLFDETFYDLPDGEYYIAVFENPEELLFSADPEVPYEGKIFKLVMYESDYLVNAQYFIADGFTDERIYPVFSEMMKIGELETEMYDTNGRITYIQWGEEITGEFPCEKYVEEKQEEINSLNDEISALNAEIEDLKSRPVFTSTQLLEQGFKFAYSDGDLSFLADADATKTKDLDFSYMFESVKCDDWSFLNSWNLSGVVVSDVTRMFMQGGPKTCEVIKNLNPDLVHTGWLSDGSTSDIFYFATNLESLEGSQYWDCFNNNQTLRGFSFVGCTKLKDTIPLSSCKIILNDRSNFGFGYCYEIERIVFHNITFNNFDFSGKMSNTNKLQVVDFSGCEGTWYSSSPLEFGSSSKNYFTTLRITDIDLANVNNIRIYGRNIFRYLNFGKNFRGKLYIDTDLMLPDPDNNINPYQSIVEGLYDYASAGETPSMTNAIIELYNEATHSLVMGDFIEKAVAKGWTVQFF